MLKQYDECFPGLSERLVRMAEIEGEHRRSMDLKEHDVAVQMVQANVYTQKLGLWFTTALAFLGLIVVAILAYHGHGWPAGIMGSGEIGVAGVIYFLRTRVGRKPVEPSR